MKRGVELSMNVIIIAAISLIVLVILVMLVTNAGTNVKKGTGCTAKPGGQCIPLTEGETCADALGEGYISMPSDCPSGETCCFKFGGDSQ